MLLCSVGKAFSNIKGAFAIKYLLIQAELMTLSEFYWNFLNEWEIETITKRFLLVLFWFVRGLMFVFNLVHEIKYSRSKLQLVLIGRANKLFFKSSYFLPIM